MRLLLHYMGGTSIGEILHVDMEALLASVSFRV